jgi:hypothetical protein
MSSLAKLLIRIWGPQAIIRAKLLAGRNRRGVELLEAVEIITGADPDGNVHLTVRRFQ